MREREILDGTRRRAAFAASGVFVFAFVIRYVYLSQAAGVPFFAAPIVDGAGYWNWAGRIADGDWRGEGVFFQAPLYPYLLGILRTLFGADLRAVYLVQAFASSVGWALLCLAGWRLFSPVAGLLAGLLGALYAPAMLFDAVIQKEALAVALICTLVWLTVRAMASSRTWTWGVVGLVLGLLVLLRENAVLLAPVLLLGSRRWRGAVAIVLGMLLVLAPVGLRNLVVGGEFALTTAQLGPNLYLGNNSRTDGTYVPFVPGRGAQEFERIDATALAEKSLGRRLSAGEVSAYWTNRTWQFISDNPAAWLKLNLRRAMLLVNAYEIADAEDLYFYSQWSTLLRGLASVWHFGVLLPLAVAGVALTWQRRRELWVYHGMILALFAGLMLFVVYARYRLPLVPFLLLFAGAGIADVPRAVAGRRWPILGVAAVLALGAAWLASVPLLDRPQRLAGSYYNWARELAEAGQTDDAIDVNRRALELDPRNASTHYNLATLLSRQQDIAGAIAEYRLAVGLQQPFPEAWNNLGIALAISGDLRGAAEAFIRALEQDSGHAGARGNLQRALQMAGASGPRDLELRISRFLRTLGEHDAAPLRGPGAE